MSVIQVRAHRAPSTTDDLAIRLRQMRVTAGFSQNQLASATGIKAHRVGHIERANYLPSENEVRSWCWSTNSDDQTSELLQMQLARVPEVQAY